MVGLIVAKLKEPILNEVFSISKNTSLMMLPEIMFSCNFMHVLLSNFISFVYLTILALICT